jgi:hypothetical protein
MYATIWFGLNTHDYWVKKQLSQEHTQERKVQGTTRGMAG